MPLQVDNNSHNLNTDDPFFNLFHADPFVMVYIPWNISGVIIALYLIPLCLGVVQTITIDDHDYTRIMYTSPSDWQHDPLIGSENLFYNRTRSYTYVPGASASLSFTGIGIRLQGPGANDQALRRITLDNQDMGVFSQYSTNWTSSSTFWDKTGLTNGPHTVIVTHNDTTTKLLVMDAWIVEVLSDSTSVPNGTVASGTTTSTTRVSGTSRSFQYSDSMGMVISIVMILLLPVYGW